MPINIYSVLRMKNMNKFCWQLRRQDIIWAKVQADVISSIMAKLEVAKNIHLQMWFFFAIWIPSGNIYILAFATAKRYIAWVSSSGKPTKTRVVFSWNLYDGFINHRTCYKFSAFIGWNYSIQTGEIILQSSFLK